MERLIFHVDVNSAYLSWEAARRISEGLEDIRLIPSAIGGDREKRTGVILAKSIPAKKYNIKTGEPVARALKKCPRLFLVPPDFSLYETNSAAFINTCRRYSPAVQKYSIDECFIDMSGMERIYPDPILIAEKIKEEIKDELGFTVNIGISSNKILAKMASDFEKPYKVHTLFPSEIQHKLWHLPIRFLFSVGRVTEEKLNRIYIQTIGDLARTDIKVVQALIGERLGKQIHEFANGIDVSPVIAGGEDAKGYSSSTTLDEDVVRSEEAYNILLSLTDVAASRMRADMVKSHCVAVTIRGNDFRDKSHQKKFEDPTDITTEIFDVSKTLFDELWDGRTPLRLLGVSLSELTKEENLQQTFFQDEERERLKKLDKAVDSIRGRFGTDIVSWGSTLQKTETFKKK